MIAPGSLVMLYKQAMTKAIEWGAFSHDLGCRMRTMTTRMGGGVGRIRQAKERCLLASSGWRERDARMWRRIRAAASRTESSNFSLSAA